MPVSPNEFVLQGDNIKFTYSSQHSVVQPSATLIRSGQTREYSSSEVIVLHTGIGTLVTVIASELTTPISTKFSVLLPGLELLDPTKTQDFSTEGIFTEIKIPEVGVNEIYTFFRMKGVASFRKIIPLATPAAAKAS